MGDADPDDVRSALFQEALFDDQRPLVGPRSGVLRVNVDRCSDDVNNMRIAARLLCFVDGFLSRSSLTSISLSSSVFWPPAI